MIVQCDNCSTKFNLPDGKLGPEGTWVRCSKCSNVFQVLPEAPAGARGDKSFQLDLSEGGPGKDEELAGLADFGLDEALGGEKASKAGGGSRAFKVIFWLLGILILLVVLVAGGLVALDRLGVDHPLLAKMRKIPGISMVLSGGSGASKGEQKAPSRIAKLALRNVRGFFRVNDKAGRLFVMQGEVVNQDQDVRTSILVRGRLTDANGKVARQAVVYAGPVFTPEELRQLSLQEMQARLGERMGPDGSPFVVSPGGAIPFMVVFADLPGNLSEFTAEVVGSEPYTGGKTGGKPKPGK